MNKEFNIQNVAEIITKIPQDQMPAFEKIISAFAPAAEEELPDWMIDDSHLDEIRFTDFFLEKYPMLCVHEKLYGLDGMEEDDRVKKVISELISPFIRTDVAGKIKKLLDLLKIRAHAEALPLDKEHIHFWNGTYTVSDRSFSSEKVICLNRLPVSYNPEAEEPEHWFGFLRRLLFEDDIPSLQEYMGYCLIPVTSAQAMMFVLGDGGEGKSRITLVFQEIFGNNMSVGHLEKLATDKFAPSYQEGKLLFMDDDMTTKALSDTSVLKTIVTLESRYELEGKHQQGVQRDLYIRLFALGNVPLTSLYDRSDGFYRRQIILKVKPKPPDRMDNHALIDKLKEETEGILLWCLEGLHRLIDHDFHFTISERSRKLRDEYRKNEDNISDFLESDGYVRFEKGTQSSSRRLYDAYSRWCDDNAEKSFGESYFTRYLRQNETRYGIRYDKNLDLGGGKKVRGYRDIYVVLGPAK